MAKLLNETAIIQALHEKHKLDNTTECANKSDKMSSEEYAKEKKKSGFKKDDWKWDSKESLYLRVGKKDEDVTPPATDPKVEPIVEEDDEGEDGIEDFVDELIYQCPECEANFSSYIELIGAIVCPECGAEITPIFVGDVEEVTESVIPAEGETPALTEVIVKIRGGKVVKLRKKRRPGYKIINGKPIKMKSSERMKRSKNAKKNRRKMHSASANIKRKKSMKIRKRRGLDDNFKVNEALLIDLMNEAIEGIYETISDTFVVPEIDSIKECFMDEEDNLVVEAIVKYDDGAEDTVEIVVEKFNKESGEFNVTESTDMFGEGTIKLSLNIIGESIEPTEFSYDIKVGEKSITESFIVESVEPTPTATPAV